MEELEELRKENEYLKTVLAQLVEATAGLVRTPQDWDLDGAMYGGIQPSDENCMVVKSPDYASDKRYFIGAELREYFAQLEKANGGTIEPSV